jgi:hypothetical protein
MRGARAELIAVGTDLCFQPLRAHPGSGSR